MSHNSNLPDTENIPQILGDDNSPLYSVYSNCNLSLPLVANCPIETLPKALALYNSDYTIYKHFSKTDMTWVIRVLGY